MYKIKKKEKCCQCGKELEFEESPWLNTDLTFCSEKCSNNFWVRDTEMRAKRAMRPLSLVN